MIITKKAIAMGNGAGVYIPKEYEGCQISIVLPEKAEEISKRVIEALAGHMHNILGVYLFGSYARNENTSFSDIDVLVVTLDEDKAIKPLISEFDARVLTLQNLKNAITRFPAITLPILKEAKTIINPLLLEELKNSKLFYKSLNWSFDEIRRTLKLIESFIELDEEDISASHIYSLFMRARICFMIDGLMNTKPYTNRAFQKELIKRGLSQNQYETYQELYQKVRSNLEVTSKIDKENILSFIELIKKYILELEHESKKKA